MMKKSVSVIIPAYNAERFILDAVNSVLRQTLSPSEVIIVNDGSTDNTLDIAKKLSDFHSQIIVIDQKNGGPSKARNAGLKIASGDYITFLDADDIWHFNKLEVQVNELERANCKVSITSLNIIDSRGVIIGENINISNGRPIEEIIDRKLSMMTPTLMFSRCLIESSNLSLDEKLAYFEDHKFIIQLIQSDAIICIEEKLVDRRVHDQSTSQSINFEKYLNSINLFESFLTENHPLLIDKFLFHVYFTLAYHNLLRGKLSDAERYSLKSIKLKFKLKTLVVYLCCKIQLLHYLFERLKKKE